MIEINNYSLAVSGNQRFRQKFYPFLWFIAAADERLLQQCPVPEQDKQAGIGMAVLCTTLAAVISAWYAVNSLFGSWFTSLLIGLFWGLIIFNLDRFMVGSMRKQREKNRFGEIAVAIPRLVLAIFIAVVISKPLEVKIFQNQIEDEQISNDKISLEEKFSGDERVFNKMDIQQKEQANEVEQASKLVNRESDALYKEYAGEYNTCLERKASLTKTKDAYNARRIQYRDNNDIENASRMTELIREKRRQIEGLRCDVVKDKMDARAKKYIDQQEKKVELETIRLGTLKKKADSARAAIETGKKKALTVISRASGDILGQLKILNNIKEKNTGMKWAGWLISFLFFILETAPVFVKILSPRGEYDTLISLHEKKAFDNEEAEEEESLQQKNARKTAALKNSVDASVVDDLVKAKVQEKILKAQAELAEKIVDAWKQEEEEGLNTNRSAYLKNKINPSSSSH